MPDFISTNLGSLVMLTPRSSDARAWSLAELGTRYFADIAYGLLAEGYTLQDSETGNYAHA